MRRNVVITFTDDQILAVDDVEKCHVGDVVITVTDRHAGSTVVPLVNIKTCEVVYEDD